MHNIINKKTLIHLPRRWCFDEILIPAYVHAVRSFFDGAGFWRTRYAKARVFHGFLSFPSKGRLFKYRFTCQRYYF
jgi:hypothetical protein